MHPNKKHKITFVKWNCNLVSQLKKCNIITWQSRSHKLTSKQRNKNWNGIVANMRLFWPELKMWYLLFKVKRQWRVDNFSKCNHLPNFTITCIYHRHIRDKNNFSKTCIPHIKIDPDNSSFPANINQTPNVKTLLPQLDTIILQWH